MDLGEERRELYIRGYSYILRKTLTLGEGVQQNAMRHGTLLQECELWIMSECRRGDSRAVGRYFGNSPSHPQSSERLGKSADLL